MGKNLGVILLIIFVIVLLIAAGIIFFKNKDRFLGEEQPVEEQIVYKNIQLFSRDTSNRQVEASYLIMDNMSKVVQEGILKEGQVEIFKDIPENRTYTFRAWNPDYYSSSVLCNMSFDACTVILKKVARPYIKIIQLKDNLYSGVVFIEGEMLQDPLICVKWRNLLPMESDLTTVRIPKEIYKNYDKCFGFGENGNTKNLTEGKYYFEIRTTPTKELAERSFELDLIDRCDDSYLEGCSLTAFVEEEI